MSQVCRVMKLPEVLSDPLTEELVMQMELPCPAGVVEAWISIILPFSNCIDRHRHTIALKSADFRFKLRPRGLMTVFIRMIIRCPYL